MAKEKATASSDSLQELWEDPPVITQADIVEYAAAREALCVATTKFQDIDARIKALLTFADSVENGRFNIGELPDSDDLFVIDEQVPGSLAEFCRLWTTGLPAPGCR